MSVVILMNDVDRDNRCFVQGEIPRQIPGRHSIRNCMLNYSLYSQIRESIRHPAKKDTSYHSDMDFASEL